jgi:hypothetical protein
MTELSLKPLAITLDELSRDGADIYETVTHVIVSQLSAPMALRMLTALAPISWEYALRDSAGTDAAASDIAEDFSPYRVSVFKPEGVISLNLLLSTFGFRRWLENELEATLVTIVGLEEEIITEATCFVPECSPRFDGQPTAVRLSPRTLVREYTSTRTVPQSITRWLLAAHDYPSRSDQYFSIWAQCAIRSLMFSIPNEIDLSSGALVFKGPPRLSLLVPGGNVDLLAELGNEGFADLQAAARWIYDLDREAENRHTLFAAELARTGGTLLNAVAFLRDNVRSALEGAKISHQMSVAKTSTENLRALADLRKAVTDETSKLADATRQVGAAVATALAVGLGLLAAKTSGTAPTWLVLATMAIVSAYICIVIYSALRFASLQISLREIWRGQIYRFLPNNEYETLVVKPGNHAMKTLRLVSCIGGGAVAVIFFAILLLVCRPLYEGGLLPDTPAPLSKDNSGP